MYIENIGSSAITSLKGEWEYYAVDYTTGIRTDSVFIMIVP